MEVNPRRVRVIATPAGLVCQQGGGTVAEVDPATGKVDLLGGEGDCDALLPAVAEILTPLAGEVVRRHGLDVDPRRAAVWLADAMMTSRSGRMTGGEPLRLRRLASAVTFLDAAWDRSRLALYAQPICRLLRSSHAPGGGAPGEFELLLRIDGSSAGEIVGDMEALGLAAWVDRAVVPRAIGVIARHPGVMFNVNIAAEAATRDFVHLVEAQLEQRGVTEPSALGLEVTERTAVDRASGFLAAAAAARIRVLADDYGAGVWSRKAVERFPTVKFDAELVRAGHLRLLTAEVDWFHRLGVRAVAEGVEDALTLDAVRAAGFDSAQGYLLGRPRPVAEWLGDR